MSNVELIFFLAGSLVALALVIWSMRIRDLERRGERKVPFLFGLFFALMFVSFAGYAWSVALELGDAQRLAAGLTAGGFSASAILMLLRWRQMGRVGS